MLQIEAQRRSCASAERLYPPEAGDAEPVTENGHRLFLVALQRIKAESLHVQGRRKE